MSTNRVHTVAYSVLALSLVALGTQLARQSSELEERTRLSEERETELRTQLEQTRKRVTDQETVTTRVIVVTDPNGTRTETKETTTKNRKTKDTTTTVVDTDSQSHETVQKDTSRVEKRTAQAVYSITPEWSSAQSMPTGVSFGVRLGTLPLWAETGWDRNRGAHVGLRIEF